MRGTSYLDCATQRERNEMNLGIGKLSDYKNQLKTRIFGQMSYDCLE